MAVIIMVEEEQSKYYLKHEVMTSHDADEAPWEEIMKMEGRNED